MTVTELAHSAGFSVLSAGDPKELSGGTYCCDLLSLVMGTAPAGCAWVTVLGNVNTVAVALLAGVACVVLAHGSTLDPQAEARARQEGIPVLGTTLPVFDAALLIHRLLEA